MNKFVLPALLLISSTDAVNTEPDFVQTRCWLYYIDVYWLHSFSCQWCCDGRPDLTGIKAINPLNDRQIVFVSTKDGAAVSAYYVLISDIPGASQGTGWLGVDGDEKYPDGRIFN